MYALVQEYKTPNYTAWNSTYPKTSKFVRSLVDSCNKFSDICFTDQKELAEIFLSESEDSYVDFLVDKNIKQLLTSSIQQGYDHFVEFRTLLVTEVMRKRNHIFEELFTYHQNDIEADHENSCHPRYEETPF